MLRAFRRSREGSNLRPTVPQTVALSTELRDHRQFSVQYIVAQLPLPVNTIETIFFSLYPFKSTSTPLYSATTHSTIVPINKLKKPGGVQYAHR